MKPLSRSRRKITLEQFGYGENVMKSVTVCSYCKSLERSDRELCSKCFRRLSEVNLYDFYKANHRSCQRCETVLSEWMDYCPVCGMRNAR